MSRSAIGKADRTSPRQLRPRGLYAGLALLLAAPAAGLTAPGTVGLVSAALRGSAYTASGESETPGMSADGRFVVFESTASDLVAGQQGQKTNVFLFDRQTGTTALVSHAAGAPATSASSDSFDAVISADGRYVAFDSYATDLLPGFAHGSASNTDTFLYDRLSGQVTLVSGSVAVPGMGCNNGSVVTAISADGRSIALVSAATDLVAGEVAPAAPTGEIFVYDRVAGTATLVSHANGAPGTPGNGNSIFPQISADGRFVAYGSIATNLVAATVSGLQDVFLYDRVTGTNTLVSRSTTGQGGNAQSWIPLLSADGNFVAFSSGATDLVPGLHAGNDEFDVFLFDRQAGSLSLVSRSAGSPLTTANRGALVTAISADGGKVVFLSTAANVVPGQSGPPGTEAVYLYDRATGTVRLVSHAAGSPATVANQHSSDGQLSADGRFVLFESQATDVVPGQIDEALSLDLFLYDAGTGSSALVTHASGSPVTAVDGKRLGPNAGVVSADGRYAAFEDGSADLVATLVDTNQALDVFVYDRDAAASSAASVRATPPTAVTATGTSTLSGPSTLSADGRFLVFQSDAPDLARDAFPSPGYPLLFLYDRIAGTNAGIGPWSGIAPGVDPGPVLSADGRYLAYSALVFASFGQVLIEVFLYDRLTGATTLVTPASSFSTSNQPAISADGRYVALLSTALGLVPGAQYPASPNVLLYDRVAGALSLVSHAAGSPLVGGDQPSSAPALSADGRYLAYSSLATDLVEGVADGNGQPDVFLFDRETGLTTLVSHAASDASATASGDHPAISADGRFVVFTSAAGNLVAGQAGAGANLFLYDRALGVSTLVSHTAGSGSAAANGASRAPSLSADGRFVAFESDATDLVAGQVDGNGQPDVFLFDRLSGASTLLSHTGASPTTACDHGASGPVIAADGGTVAWTSSASDLVPGQDAGNPHAGVFLYDRRSGATRLASTNGTTHGNGSSGHPVLSADGSWLAFDSLATDLVAGDENGRSDVFLFGSPFTGRALFTLPPCRLLDTRQPGPGPLVSGAVRTIATHGVCGIPATAKALVANITVTQPTALGHLTLFPADLSAPLASTLNFGAGQTRSNNAILPLSLDGLGTLSLSPSVLGGGTVQVIVDVTGYFE